MNTGCFQPVNRGWYAHSSLSKCKIGKTYFFFHCMGPATPLPQQIWCLPSIAGTVWYPPQHVCYFPSIASTIQYGTHSNTWVKRSTVFISINSSYLFQYLLQESTQKFMILAIFRLIPNHIVKVYKFICMQIMVDLWLIMPWVMGGCF